MPVDEPVNDTRSGVKVSGEHAVSSGATRAHVGVLQEKSWASKPIGQQEGARLKRFGTRDCYSQESSWTAGCSLDMLGAVRVGYEKEDTPTVVSCDDTKSA
jgi:hypothetical protein